MLKLHLLHTMPDDVKRQLDELLQDTAWCEALQQRHGIPGCACDNAVAPEEVARAWLFRAEIARLLKKNDDARQFDYHGLELAPKLGSRGILNGTAATLHLTLSLLGVEDHLKALDRCPRPCRAFDEALKLKSLGVGKSGVSDETGRNAGTPERPGMPTEEWTQDEEFFSAEEDCNDHFNALGIRMVMPQVALQPSPEGRCRKRGKILHRTWDSPILGLPSQLPRYGEASQKLSQT